MRAGIILLGVMLLIIGIFFIVIGFDTIDTKDTGQRDMAKTVLVSGVVVGFLGLIICFVGLRQRMRKEEDVKKKEPPKILEQPSKDEAVNTIKVRYAKGEITKKQYKKMMKDIEK